MEAIILAGGLGTRLRGVIGEETPKCMAPVAGKPFLHYLLQWAAQQGITRVVLSLGHQSEAVIDWLKSQRLALEIDWVIEAEPLGTGGGISLAMQSCTADNVFVLNGDTLFLADLNKMLYRHLREAAELTVMLKEMRDFDRYGTVCTHPDGHAVPDVILSFQEKMPQKSGKINGGIYLVSHALFLDRQLPQKFSFEKDYMERFVGEGKFYGFDDAGYFIDIGVPEDYDRAQADFQVLFSQE